VTTASGLSLFWRPFLRLRHHNLQAQALAVPPVIALEEISPEWSDRPLSLLVVFRGPGRRLYQHHLQRQVGAEVLVVLLVQAEVL